MTYSLADGSTQPHLIEDQTDVAEDYCYLCGGHHIRKEEAEAALGMPCWAQPEPASPADLATSWIYGETSKVIRDLSPVIRLSAITSATRGVDLMREAAVIEALKSGATWAQIGHSLGISRQAAQQRFRQYRHLAD